MDEEERQQRNREREETEDGWSEHAGLPRFPTFIAIPLLLTFFFALPWCWSVVSEYLRHEVLIFPTEPELLYLTAPFFLALPWTLIWLFLAAVPRLYERIIGL